MEENPIVVVGEETALVVGSEESVIVEKYGESWKIPESNMIATKYTKQIGAIYINVLQYNLSDEYYIRISNSEGEPLEITDSRNSKFYEDQWGEEEFDKEIFDYWGYINGLDEVYTININGKNITLME